MGNFPLTEFERLCAARDLAAYRVVGALDAAIVYAEVGDTQESLAILKRARAEYEQADARITEFRNSLNSNQGEPLSHGNRPAS